MYCSTVCTIPVQGVCPIAAKASKQGDHTCREDLPVNTAEERLGRKTSLSSVSCHSSASKFTVGWVLPAFYTSSRTSFLQIRFLSFAIFITIITVFPSSPSCFQLFSFCFQKAVTSNQRIECTGTLHLLTSHYFQKIRKGQTVAGEKWFLFLFIDLRDNCRNGNCIIYRSHHSNVSQNWALKKPLHVKA